MLLLLLEKELLLLVLLLLELLLLLLRGVEDRNVALEQVGHDALFVDVVIKVGRREELRHAESLLRHREGEREVAVFVGGIDL